MLCVREVCTLVNLALEVFFENPVDRAHVIALHQNALPRMLWPLSFMHCKGPLRHEHGEQLEYNTYIGRQSPIAYAFAQARPHVWRKINSPPLPRLQQ